MRVAISNVGRQDGTEARGAGACGAEGPRGRGLSSAGAGASGRGRRPRSLAMWPSSRSAAASCAAARSRAARCWRAACPGRPASPCCLTLLNLKQICLTLKVIHCLKQNIQCYYYATIGENILLSIFLNSS